MATFFCFTCSRHKPEGSRQPGMTGKKAICIPCNERRKVYVAASDKSPQRGVKHTKAGQRVIFTHLRNIGEL
jgi:hypothetical protein